MGGLPWPGTVLILLLNNKDLRGKKKNISLLHTHPQTPPARMQKSWFPRQMPHARTNPAAWLYLAVEEASILHSAVWLIQLLVSVAHVFVPEPCLLLRRDLKQRPHLLLYCICRESGRIHFTALGNVQPRTERKPGVAHRLCLLYWNNAWPQCPCCCFRTGWAQAGKLPPCSAWQTCHVQSPGGSRLRSEEWFEKGQTDQARWPASPSSQWVSDHPGSCTSSPVCSTPRLAWGHSPAHLSGALLEPECLDLNTGKKKKKRLNPLVCLTEMAAGILECSFYLRTAQSYQLVLDKDFALRRYTCPSCRSPHTSSIVWTTGCR